MGIKNSIEIMFNKYAGWVGAGGGMIGFFSFDVFVPMQVVLDPNTEIVFGTFKFFFAIITAIASVIAGKLTAHEMDRHLEKKKLKKK